jgi:hypothetical protein
MVYNTNTSIAVPSAYIAIHKNRLKIYDDNKIYLQDKQNFQIELFNTQISNVLAKIKINGKLIGSGIIVRPGERVFLERYLDVAKLFEFQTYEVSKSGDVANAIRNNGLVEVEFFEEELSTFATSFISNVYDYNQHSNLNLTGTPNWGPDTVTYTSGITNMSCNFMDNNLTAEISANPIKRTKSTKETGRIEKGGNSDQKLNEIDMKFSTFSMSNYVFKLLPTSEQQITVKNLKKYCENCGYRIRSQSAKFCSSCGCELT